MPPLKNVTIAMLACALAAVGVRAWQQQRELARLLAAKGDGAGTAVPLLTLRGGTSRHVTLPPLHRNNPASGEERVESFGADFGFGRAAAEVRRGTPGPRNFAKLAQNPEFLSALATFQQGDLDARFAALFRKLNLTQDELEKFKRLLVQKESAEFDVVAVDQAVSESPLPPEEMHAVVNEIRAGVEQDIRASLGAERYAVYRDFENTLPQRATVAQLEQRLSYSSTPLTAAQSEAMVHVLAEHSVPAKAPAAAPATVVAGDGAAEVGPLIRPVSSAAIVTDEAVASAQSILAAEQLAALQQIQGEQLSAQRAGQILRATLPGANVPPLDWKLLMQ